jgi:malate synthase
MDNYITISNIKIKQELYDFIDTKVIPDLGLNTNDFFTSVAKIINTFTTENTKLLTIRKTLQQQLDNWHQNNEFNVENYKQFLKDIEYIEQNIDDFTITTKNVDQEIATIAAPQLVVPISNPRFVLNAVNARFGSLYDALYSSNIIDNTIPKTAKYDDNRGRKVISWVNDLLDEIIPLQNGSYHHIKTIDYSNQNLNFILTDNTNTTLKNQQIFQGCSDNSVLLQHHNLYIEIIIKNNVIKDVILEAAATTIVDFEDSVATVSDSEKIAAYNNLLKLMQRKLSATFEKNGQLITRTINADKTFITTNNNQISLKTTSLILIRNVGHHMLSNLIVDENNNPIYEGILDACITTLIALYDLQHYKQNSKTGSIYIVKPKMHGSKEVEFTTKLMTLVEKELNLTKNTIKLGIMDEEKRTSINLKQCIYVAKDRVVFINTGFLDRTGDEIRTAMYAGVMERKDDIKQSKWISAYEKLNVQTALDCGFLGKAQIGKGMWAEPDNMQGMLKTKISHLQMGANCSWVPSPTAAILHAIHYHQVSTKQVQQQLINNSTVINKDDLLYIPLLQKTLTNKDITDELTNNIQGILGYVARWVSMGIGCSKVADINNIGLMEDRATLRISSQHIANWLLHNVCSKEQIEELFQQMATLVDRQNKNDPNYKNIALNYDLPAFKAALTLVYDAIIQDNGYTENILTKYREIELKNIQ